MVLTRILVLSDTHGRKDIPPLPSEEVDLVIHCGDLTEQFKLSEYENIANLLDSVKAPLKLVIAGNHDVTLDEDTFEKHLLGVGLSWEDPTVLKEYGSRGEALQCLVEDNEINVLSEGSHTFILKNGAKINVYASPYTPRKQEEGALGSDEAGWAYQYEDGLDFDIPSNTHIVITHGPPEGVLDRVAGKRRGCPHLFASVAKARPLLHCFGHIHAGWGAKEVIWRDGRADHKPSHFESIDHDRSTLVEGLAKVKAGKFDDEQRRQKKEYMLQGLLQKGFCDVKTRFGGGEGGTMFVNAAMEGDDDVPFQPPMVVTLDLPTK